MGKRSIQIVVLVAFAYGSVTVPVWAQPPPELMQYMQQVRQGNALTIPQSWPPFKQPSALLNSLDPYRSDSLPAVRSAANRLIHTVAIQTKDLALQQRCVVQLAKAANDTHPENVSEAYTMLTHYQGTDFNNEAMETLRSLFNSQPLYRDRLVRLIGFVGINELQSEMQLLATSQNKNNTLRWAALLSLARMGSEEAAQAILKKVQRLPVEDDVVYDVFPDLVFTRHPLLFGYLITVLHSDEAGCSPADPDQSGKIPCAYRVMEMLAPVLENFPLKVGPSGDIQTRDYPRALQEARTWFIKHSGSFTINRDQY